MGNLLSNDQSTLYLDASSGFDVNLPITVVAVASTRLGTAVTFKEMSPSALLSNFSVTSKAIGSAPFTLTAPVSNSAGAFTYSSSNPAVATVSGSTVTIIATGTTTITATQAATATHASNSITAIFAVTPPFFYISLNNGTLTYTGNAALVPTSSALFFEGDLRGTGLEWFAVVKDGMKAAITAYANGTNGPFIPSGQTVPVPFNNIVTTLMTNMTHLFMNTSFNQPIGSWDTTKVMSMDAMFRNTISFNQPIGSWNVANVENMDGIFSHANSFNQPIGSWNTAKVLNMNEMFYRTNFNQTINSWNTANVKTMANMFYNNIKFNQPIGSWNTATVTNMYAVFNNAISFNQPINTWDVDNVTSFSLFRSGSALSDENTPPKFL
jgi:surface protein